MRNAFILFFAVLLFARCDQTVITGETCNASICPSGLAFTSQNKPMFLISTDLQVWAADAADTHNRGWRVCHTDLRTH